MSTFRVLHTAVTCASKNLAICTAKVPTPPAAPLIKIFLSRLNMPLVTKTLQSSECRYRYRRGLLEGDVVWLADECRFGSAHILGKGSFAHAEDGIAWFELGDVLADGFDVAGYINAGSFDFWFAQTEE